jgi:hypothetical protein
LPFITEGVRNVSMKRPLNSGVIRSSSGSAMSCSTKSISQRVPMMAMSALALPEMSVVSFCCSTSHGTTSIWMSVSGLAASNFVATSSKYGPVLALYSATVTRTVAALASAVEARRPAPARSSPLDHGYLSIERSLC